MESQEDLRGVCGDCLFTAPEAARPKWEPDQVGWTALYVPSSVGTRDFAHVPPAVYSCFYLSSALPSPYYVSGLELNIGFSFPQKSKKY